MGGSGSGSGGGIYFLGMGLGEGRVVDYQGREMDDLGNGGGMELREDE